ncbi:MAG: YceI family protein [Cyclobacteriaceae bacterium]
MKLRTYIVLYLIFGISLSGFSQKRLSTNTGVVSFVSKAELELIKASSNKVTGLLDPATNQFAFSILVTSFQGFNSSLQQSHFNENYMESSKFPKATFTGKIIEQVDLRVEGVYEVRAKGDLTIHGEAQPRIIKAKIIINKEGATVESEFTVPLIDQNIRIPKIVNRKIATEILVNFKAAFTWK